jgi:hypothetical protein
MAVLWNYLSEILSYHLAEWFFIQAGFATLVAVTINIVVFFFGGGEGGYVVM